MLQKKYIFNFVLVFSVLLIIYFSSGHSIYNTIKILNLLSMCIWELLKFLY